MDIPIETERLVLRLLTAADLDALVALDSDPEVMRYLTGGRPTSRAAMERDVLPAWLSCNEAGNGFGYWAAIEKETGEFAGWFHLKPAPGAPGDIELGYRLRRAAWGRGLATEGAKALVARAFGLPGVRRVVAFTMAVNTGSRRVMEKAGLRYVRTFHDHFDDPIPGTEHGEVEYALDAGDWSSAAG